MTHASILQSIRSDKGATDPGPPMWSWTGKTRTL